MSWSTNILIARPGEKRAPHFPPATTTTTANAETQDQKIARLEREIAASREAVAAAKRGGSSLTERIASGKPTKNADGETTDAPGAVIAESEKPFRPGEFAFQSDEQINAGATRWFETLSVADKASVVRMTGSRDNAIAGEAAARRAARTDQEREAHRQTRR